MMNRFGQKTYRIMHSGWFSRLFVPLCVLSVMLFVFRGTQMGPNLTEFVHIIDATLFFIFVWEALVRIFSQYNPLKNLFQPIMLIDLLVLVGYGADLWGGGGILEAFIIFRVLKLLSVFRYIPLTERFFHAFSNYHEEFRLFALSFITVLTIGSFGMFRLENTINPSFGTLGESFWWSIVTMSTVGYGDVVPITRGGKVLSAMIMIMGLATMAMLTGMITKVFIDHFFGKRHIKCPVCAYPHHDTDAKHCKNCGGEL